MSLTKSNDLRYSDSTKLERDKENQLALKKKIDTATATPQETSAYMELCETLEIETRSNKSAIQSNKEIAYNLGKHHDIGSATFYRPYTPQGATHWIEKHSTPTGPTPQTQSDQTGSPCSPRKSQRKLPQIIRPSLPARSLTPRELKNVGKLYAQVTAS